MAKIKRIIDHKNLSNDLLDKLYAAYPDGYDESDFVKFQNAQGDSINAVPLETEDAMYLVKVTVISRETAEGVEIEDPAVLEEEVPSTAEQEKEEFKPEQDEFKDDEEAGFTDIYEDTANDDEEPEEEPYTDPDDEDDEADDYNGSRRRKSKGNDYDDEY